MRNILFTIIVFILFRSQSAAQQLENYIAEGFKNNIVLREKSIALDKALIALKESKSFFLPTSYLESQYTFANGGRTINMPVGDMLNPVYKTLNQITRTNDYPQVKNFSEQFFPDNFYDVRIKSTMPIINPELKIGNAINTQKIIIEKNEIDIYKRELLKEIKTAYYNFLMASEAIHVYQNALIVSNQNLRATQSSFNNGKGLKAYVIRASLEVNSLESQAQIAFYEREKAKSYFNFLLNRPLTDTVVVALKDVDDKFISLASYKDTNIVAREELHNLDVASNINNNLLKLSRSFRTPRVNGFVDLGAQDFDLKVNNKSFFYLLGLQMQFPIFSGKRNLYKIQQNLLDIEKLSLEKEQVTNQLKIKAVMAHDDLLSAYEKYKLSVNQLNQANNYFNLINHGYKEGVNTFLEFLDASTQLTNAQLQINISKYKFLSASADYERQTASYSFKQN